MGALSASEIGLSSCLSSSVVPAPARLPFDADAVDGANHVSGNLVAARKDCCSASRPNSMSDWPRRIRRARVQPTHGRRPVDAAADHSDGALAGLLGWRGRLCPTQRPRAGTQRGGAGFTLLASNGRDAGGARVAPRCHAAPAFFFFFTAAPGMLADLSDTVASGPASGTDGLATGAASPSEEPEEVVRRPRVPGVLQLSAAATSSPSRPGSSGTRSLLPRPPPFGTLLWDVPSLTHLTGPGPGRRSHRRAFLHRDDAPPPACLRAVVAPCARASSGVSPALTTSLQPAVRDRMKTTTPPRAAARMNTARSHRDSCFASAAHPVRLHAICHPVHRAAHEELLTRLPPTYECRCT